MSQFSLRFFEVLIPFSLHIGIDEIGIYRVSGSTSEVANLKANFNNGNDLDLLSQQMDPNAVASLFKSWLRELPEPVLTKQVSVELNKLYSSENDHGGSRDQEHFTRCIELCQSLPVSHRALLYLLFSHLHRVQANESNNKMTMSNLQVIFCPTL
ncbi:Rho GTPase-activating protein domain-containing protein, partial [Phlyctochytrium arcticum]